MEIRVQDSFKRSQEMRVSSIYFGGGTPSLFSTDSLGRLLDTIMNLFSKSQHTEITLEVNPKTIDKEKLQEIHAIGINRLSTGVQSFQNMLLQTLGRIHDSEDALRLYEDAQAIGFDNISLDLIFSIPGQTQDDWQRDVNQAISLKPQHISVYNLTIEENTPFREMKRQGKISLPDEETQVHMYRHGVSAFVHSGYEQYEISNFALPGFRCRHNEGYWTLKEYLGFGPGAHSYLKEDSSGVEWGVRWKNIPDPFEYISRLSEASSPVMEKEELTREEAVKEAIFLGLRRLEGINFQEFQKRFGISLKETYSPVITFLERENFVSIQDGNLKLTDQGVLLSNDVFVKFF